MKIKIEIEAEISSEIAKTVCTVPEASEASPDKIQITMKDGKICDLLKCREEEDGTIYIFDEVIEESSMENAKIAGALRRIEELLPDDVEFCEFEDGSLLRLATEKEIFGVNEIGEAEEGEQFECMKKRKNRIAVDWDGCLRWWWLSTTSKYSSAAFALVSSYGLATSNYASYTTVGVRPLVKIRDR